MYNILAVQWLTRQSLPLLCYFLLLLILPSPRVLPPCLTEARTLISPCASQTVDYSQDRCRPNYLRTGVCPTENLTIPVRLLSCLWFFFVFFFGLSFRVTASISFNKILVWFFFFFLFFSPSFSVYFKNKNNALLILNGRQIKNKTN